MVSLAHQRHLAQLLAQEILLRHYQATAQEVEKEEEVQEEEQKRSGILRQTTCAWQAAMADAWPAGTWWDTVKGQPEDYDDDSDDSRSGSTSPP